MKDLRGRAAVVTGASRGIGVHVARALAAEGMDLVLAARTASALDSLRDELQARQPGRFIAVPTDVSRLGDLESLADAATQAFGAVDVLVNNAGIESVFHFHKLAPKAVDEVLDVNLRGALHLTRLVLPGMLSRGRGHIVNMSSLAGKAGPACNEAYATTKAALIGFTQSLRGSYRREGVSASVICPGFVDAGMYARWRQEQATVVPRRLGVSSADAVAQAVVRAIRMDLPEAIVNPVPLRPLLALYALAPGLTERLSRYVDANSLFRHAAEWREKQAADSA